MARPRDEFQIIDRIRQAAGGHPRIPIPIGDDAAALAIAASGTATPTVLVTTDLLMEGVHFTLPPATAEEVGYKAIAVNLSDIAAMAGRPLGAFISLALPRSRGADFVDRLYDGIFEAAGGHDVAVAGGDTNIWDGPLVINVAVVGEPTGRGPVRRAGARPGDWIMVSGALGGSLSGRHLRPVPRVAEGLALHEAVSLSAMIDVSDGVASDLRHILRESGVGAVVDETALPIHVDVPDSLPSAERVERALCDGEDFELLFTVSPEEGGRLIAKPPFVTPLTRIGEIVTGDACQLRRRDGSLAPLPRGGWEHRFQG